MQREYTISEEKNAISKNGIEEVCFDAFISKSSVRKNSRNNYEQGCSIDFRCRSFTGKERDEETGYGYFGARYMDYELMTMWLSVDPMADKYPSFSPYAYCAWNPVKLVDPNGREMWKPEILEDGTVNYVAEEGDNAKTLHEQYDISKDAAAKMYATLGNGRVSGESAREITGDEILKLRWRNNSNARKAYHLGFAIMYNHEKQDDSPLVLNNFFSGMPQSTGENCVIRTPKYLSDITNKVFGIKDEPFFIPLIGSKSIPVTFFDCRVSGQMKTIRDCGGIQSKTPGTVNLRMNCYGSGVGCNGAPAIMIQVYDKYEDIFIRSYGH